MNMVSVLTLVKKGKVFLQRKMMNCVSDTVQLKNVNAHTAKARRGCFMKHRAKMELAT